jgi:ribosome-binding protein aMBF1 (putative translation factor)
MSSILPERAERLHRVNGESRPRMAKAALPKGENREFRSELRVIGECLDEARRYLGWTVDQLAQELSRDSKQIARWIRGEERTQLDTAWSVPELRQPFVVALAKRANCEIETIVRVRIA